MRPLIFSCALLVSYFFLSRDLPSFAQRRELFALPAQLVHFHFDHRMALSDLLWVRAIQDFDYCEKLDSKKQCGGKSWLAQTLELVTDLDPKFRMAYSAGAMALSVIISDSTGASKLLDKALVHQPDDWILHYKAAYHSLFEEHDKVKAAARMKRAAELGAPDWVYILAGRLFTEAGEREMAQRILLEMQAMGLSEAVQERLKEKLRQTSQE